MESVSHLISRKEKKIEKKGIDFLYMLSYNDSSSMRAKRRHENEHGDYHRITLQYLLR